jgi:hypothetical protein
MNKLVYKTFLLSVLTLLILSVAPGTVFADGGNSEFTKSVNGYHVTLVFEEPVMVGENPIHVRVNDAMDMPVSNADVQVSVVEGNDEHAEEKSEHTEGEEVASANDTMHGMEAVPEQPVEAPSEAHDEMGMVALEAGHESGEYAGEIAIDSAGDWMIRVHLTVPGELTEVDFPLSIAQSKSNSTGILAGFFTVNAAIIAAAIIFKPKPVSTPSNEHNPLTDSSTHADHWQ